MLTECVVAKLTVRSRSRYASRVSRIDGVEGAYMRLKRQQKLVSRYTVASKEGQHFRLGPGQVASLFPAWNTITISQSSYVPPSPQMPWAVNVNIVGKLPALCFLLPIISHEICRRECSVGLSLRQYYCRPVPCFHTFSKATHDSGSLQLISGGCSSETLGDCRGEWNAGPGSMTYWSTRQSLLPVKSGQCEVSRSPPDHGHLIYRHFGHWLDR